MDIKCNELEKVMIAISKMPSYTEYLENAQKDDGITSPMPDVQKLASDQFAHDLYMICKDFVSKNDFDAYVADVIGFNDTFMEASKYLQFVIYFKSVAINT